MIDHTRRGVGSPVCSELRPCEPRCVFAGASTGRPTGSSMWIRRARAILGSHKQPGPVARGLGWLNPGRVEHLLPVGVAHAEATECKDRFWIDARRDNICHVRKGIRAWHYNRSERAPDREHSSTRTARRPWVGHFLCNRRYPEGVFLKQKTEHSVQPARRPARRKALVY